MSKYLLCHFIRYALFYSCLRWISIRFGRIHLFRDWQINVWKMREIYTTKKIGKLNSKVYRLRRYVVSGRNMRLKCGKGLARSGHLLRESSYDATCGVVLIQGVRQLLARRLQLLSQSKWVKHHRVPLVLQALQQGGYACSRWGLWLHQGVHFKLSNISI